MKKKIISKLLITLILCLSFTFGIFAGCGAEKYTVSFATNGGSGVASQSVDGGKTATKPADPEKDGYVFVGWYSDANLTTEYDFGTAVTANTTVYAKWVVGEYTVTFMWGSEVHDTKTVGYGKTVEKPADPVKEGYALESWTFSNGTVFDFTTKIESDLTLYAKLKKVTTDTNDKEDDKKPDDGKEQTTEYTVTFMADGVKYDEKTVKKGNTVAKPANDPHKDGNTFEEWTLSDGSAFDFTTPIDDDLTLTAKFKPDDEENPDTPKDVYYTVIFNSNGGSTVKKQSVKKDGTATEPQAPIKANQVFGGWYDQSLSNQYSFNTPVTGNITLYAKWNNPETVTVSFDSKGGSLVDAQEIAYGSTATLPKAPTRSGYTFGGWYTDEACNNSYNFSNTVTTSFTLYAKWTNGTASASSYEVTFNSLGGSAVSAQEVAHGEKALEPKAPTRSGYTFGGWYTEEACTSAYNFNNAVTSTLTLYAKWTDNSALPQYQWNSEQADFTNSAVSSYSSSGNKTTSSITVGSFTYTTGVYFDGSGSGLRVEKGDINTQGKQNAISFELNGENNAISFKASAASSNKVVTIVLYKEGTQEPIYSFDFTEGDTSTVLSFAIGGDNDLFTGSYDNKDTTKNLTSGKYYLYSTNSSRIGDLTIYEYEEV